VGKGVGGVRWVNMSWLSTRIRQIISSATHSSISVYRSFSLPYSKLTPMTQHPTGHCVTVMHVCAAQYILGPSNEYTAHNSCYWTVPTTKVRPWYSRQCFAPSNRIASPPTSFVTFCGACLRVTLL
jgi:hypothetical protein